MIEPKGRLLLIGASSEAGLAIAREYLNRGWFVMATEVTLSTPLHDLIDIWDGKLQVEQVDTTSPRQLAALRSRLEGKRFDLLLYNAEVSDSDEDTVADVSTLKFLGMMSANALCPLRCLETLQDLVKENGSLGVRSSRQERFHSSHEGKGEVYRASMAALNSLMRSFRARLGNDPRTLLLVAPDCVGTGRVSRAEPDTEGGITQMVSGIEAQAGKGSLHYLDAQGSAAPW